MEHVIDQIVAFGVCVLGAAFLTWTYYSVYELGKAVGVDQENSRWKEEIISRGLAEYRCDPETGDVAFVWKNEGGPGDGS